MGSEDQVFNLMKLLDDGIQQAENIESKLDSYDRILQVQGNLLVQSKGRNLQTFITHNLSHSEEFVYHWQHATFYLPVLCTLGGPNSERLRL